MRHLYIAAHRTWIGRPSVALVALVTALVVTSNQASGQKAVPDRTSVGPQVSDLWLIGTPALLFSRGLPFHLGVLQGELTTLIGTTARRPWRTQGDVLAAWSVPSLRAARIETFIGGFRSNGVPTSRSRGVRGGARFSRWFHRGGVWLGGTLSRSSARETTLAARSVLAGAWTTLGQIGLTLSVRGVGYEENFLLGRDTVFNVAGYDFLSRRTQRVVNDQSYFDTEVVASRRVGPLDLLLSTGARFTNKFRANRQMWARVGAELPVLDALTLQVAGGHQPGFPEQRTRSGRFVMLGFRWSVREDPKPDPPPPLVGSPPLPPAPERASPQAQVIPLPNGAGHELLIRNVTGRQVEIMGDPTNWSSVKLTRLGSGMWRIVLILAPGTYRMNMRVDGGAWRALPGQPTVEDEFGGEVGLIVIEEGVKG